MHFALLLSVTAIFSYTLQAHPFNELIDNVLSDDVEQPMVASAQSFMSTTQAQGQWKGAEGGKMKGHVHLESSAHVNGKLVHHRSFDSDLPVSENVENNAAAQALTTLSKPLISSLSEWIPVQLDPAATMSKTDNVVGDSQTLELLVRRAIEVLRTLAPSALEDVCNYFDGIEMEKVSDPTYWWSILTQFTQMVPQFPAPNAALYDAIKNVTFPVDRTHQLWKDLNVCTALKDLQAMPSDEVNHVVQNVITHLKSLGLDESLLTIGASDAIASKNQNLDEQDADRTVHKERSVNHDGDEKPRNIRQKEVFVPTLTFMDPTRLSPKVEALIDHRRRVGRAGTKVHVIHTHNEFPQTENGLNTIAGRSIPNYANTKYIVYGDDGIQSDATHPNHYANQMTLVYILCGSIFLVALILLVCFLKANTAQTHRAAVKGGHVNLNDVIVTPQKETEVSKE